MRLVAVTLLGLSASCLGSLWAPIDTSHLRALARRRLYKRSQCVSTPFVNSRPRGSAPPVASGTGKPRPKPVAAPGGTTSSVRPGPAQPTTTGGGGGAAGSGGAFAVRNKKGIGFDACVVVSACLG